MKEYGWHGESGTVGRLRGASQLLGQSASVLSGVRTYGGVAPRFVACLEFIFTKKIIFSLIHK